MRWTTVSAGMPAHLNLALYNFILSLTVWWGCVSTYYRKITWGSNRLCNLSNISKHIKCSSRIRPGGTESKACALRKKRKHIFINYDNMQDKSRAKEDVEYATYLLPSNLHTLTVTFFSWVNFICHQECIYHRDKCDSLQKVQFLKEWYSCPQIIAYERIP